MGEEGKLQKNSKYYLYRAAKGMKPTNKTVETEMQGTRSAYKSAYLKNLLKEFANL